jgi:hypothetical protein
MRGLLIRAEPLNAILRGEKTWEIRCRRVNIRGKIALIQSGSGYIVGTCEIVDCIGPLTLKELLRTTRLHGIPLKELRVGLPYTQTFAWILRNAKRFEKPIPYKHKFGIVTWHPLPDL